MNMRMTEPFVLGWEEWVALPDLGLPAIKTKVDTGARTSALHSFMLETFGPLNKPKLRFGIHPIPDKSDIEVYCSAEIIDRREVISSNGESELRYVIQTPVRLGAREWPIEMTLTNREGLSYRMLLGRQAIRGDMIVNPGLSCLHDKLSYKVYEEFPRAHAADRSLRIALLTREPDNYSSRRLLDAAERRGHVLEMIDTARCYMSIDATAPAVHYDGKPLPRYDAVIPRIGTSITHYGMAVVRQFEMMGAYCLNPASAIGASRDKLLAHQMLAARKINMPQTAFAHSPEDNDNLAQLIGGPPVVLKLLSSTQGRGVVLAESRKAAASVIGALRTLDANFLVQEYVKEAAGADVRCFVIGRKVVAAMQRQAAAEEFRANIHRGGTAQAVKLTSDERKLAVKATRVLGLNVAGVDLLRSSSGPKVLEVNSSPGLQGIEKLSEKDIAGLIIDHIAENVRAVVLRR